MEILIFVFGKMADKGHELELYQTSHKTGNTYTHIGHGLGFYQTSHKSGNANIDKYFAANIDKGFGIISSES